MNRLSIFVGEQGAAVSNRRGRFGNRPSLFTALAQATDTADKPDFQVHTVFGIGL